MKITYIKFQHVLRILIVTILLLSGLQACDEHQTILIIEVEGGCMRVGPNCPRYELRMDGSYDVYRQGEPEIVKTAQLDQALVNEWLIITEITDLNELREKLGEGSCNACIDGVDFKYTVVGKVEKITFDSQKEDFYNNKEPFFLQTHKLRDAMRINAPLETKHRH